ncbi:MAG: ATP-binding protein [Sumerlaeia bacterium]
MLHWIPITAIILLNLIIIAYVVRERDRTRSGFFLVVNAISLILWSAGVQAWEWMHESRVLALACFALLLVPANLLYFVGTRPKPFRPGWTQPWVLAALFLPPVLLTPLLDYRVLAQEKLTSNFYTGEQWRAFFEAGGVWPTFYGIVMVLGCMVVLAVRYETIGPSPVRTLCKHLSIVIIGPIAFASVFAVTTKTSGETLAPSPSLLAVFIAQFSILAVIRQEEIERPMALSRWIYYTAAVLVGFAVSVLLYTAYEGVAGKVLLARTVQATIFVTIVLFVIAASMPRVRSMFDRVMFRRVAEYRELFRDSQLQLRDTRERLRRAERLSVVGETAARIAHEIKNPLGPIKGYTEMMRDKLDDMSDEDFPHRTRFLRHLEIISEEVEAIDRKVRQLLNMAKKPAVTFEPEDINAMVERAATLLRFESEGADSDTGAPVVRTYLAPHLPDVLICRERVEEAISNVCRNAIEAVQLAGLGGEIVLTTEVQEDENGVRGVAIIVEDSGPGFSDEALARLFTPFYTEKPGGTGLGLSIVKSHVEVHNGRAQFEKRDPCGARVTLWFPLNPEAASAIPNGEIDRELHPSGDSQRKMAV